MKKVSVPVMLETLVYRETILDMLKQARADRVFLAMERSFDRKEYDGRLRLLADGIAYFRENGFEVGVWIGETVGHWQHPPEDTDGGRGLRLWTDTFGETHNGNFCPADEKFLCYVESWIEDIARLAPDAILLDDDFRMSMHAADNGCLCDAHLAAFCREAGETLTREDIRRRVFCGKPGKYRDIWLKVQGDTLRHAAVRFRAAVDRVDPSVRLGLCAVLSTWGMDGVGAPELADILAGDTRPLLRLIGAPYWPQFSRFSLSEIVELQRQELRWCGDTRAEIMVEGDTYPRPRFRCPALRLELYDMATRAACDTDGILKYMLDYTASPEYETGYITRHVRDLPMLSRIEAMFAGKRDAGVRVITPYNRVANAAHPDDPNTTWNCWDWFCDPAITFLTDCSLPLAFAAEEGMTAAFDTAADELTPEQMTAGAILDIRAAMRLTRRGVDVGLLDAECDGHPTEEFFPAYGETVAVSAGIPVYRMALREGAEVLSEFTVGGRRIPGAYRYVNASGQRFLVFPFVGGRPALSLTYCRQRQIADTARRFGQPVPAVVENSPELYVLVKQDDTTVTVGLFNFFSDDILTPFVAMGQPFTAIADTLNCRAQKENGGIRLLTDIPPMSCAAITVKK